MYKTAHTNKMSQSGTDPASLKNKYGNISSTSIGALKRGLLTLTQQGGNQFFGEPAIKLEHLMQIDFSGKGVISILDATTLVNDAGFIVHFYCGYYQNYLRTYQKLAILKNQNWFFFDEAHLLFNSAPKILLEKIDQMVRLIRSKGVGIYFIT